MDKEPSLAFHKLARGNPEEVGLGNALDNPRRQWGELYPIDNPKGPTCTTNSQQVVLQEIRTKSETRREREVEAGIATLGRLQ